MTRCRAVVVLWRLCTVGKVRLQQGSTMVVPCCSLPGLTCTGRTETLVTTIVRRSSPNLGELRPPPQLTTSTQRQNVD